MEKRGGEGRVREGEYGDVGKVRQGRSTEWRARKRRVGEEGTRIMEGERKRGGEEQRREGEYGEVEEETKEEVERGGGG